MMAIKSRRHCPINTAEFVELGFHNIFEGTHERWVKQSVGEAVPQQASGEFLLTFHEACRTKPRRKWRRKVKVEASIDSPFAGYGCGPLRVLHEDHGTHR